MHNGHHPERELIKFLSQHMAPGETITVQTDLLEAQILDSLLMMDLVLHLEATYGIQLDVADLSPRRFRSVASLALLVRDKLGERERPADESAAVGDFSTSDLDVPSLLCNEHAAFPFGRNER